MRSSFTQEQQEPCRTFNTTEKTAEGSGSRNIVEEYRLKIMAKLGKKVGSSATAETFNATDYAGSQPDFIS